MDLRRVLQEEQLPLFITYDGRYFRGKDLNIGNFVFKDFSRSLIDNQLSQELLNIISRVPKNLSFTIYCRRTFSVQIPKDIYNVSRSYPRKRPFAKRSLINFDLLFVGRKSILLYRITDDLRRGLKGNVLY